MNTIGTLPSWLSDLASALQNKSVSKRVTAQTSVTNLPTVNWENETFYVKFNESGAVLYNKFATVVKEIEHATTIEEVDKFLNDNLVTAAQQDTDITEDSDDTLEKTASNDDIEDDEEPEEIEEIEIVGDDDEIIQEIQNVMNEEEEEKEDVVDIQQEISDLKHEVQELKEVVESLQKLLQPQNNESEDTSANVEDRLSTLEEKYAELYHAYTSPDNDQYDLNCQDKEMEHVNKNIELTQKIIDKEHELDLSKQEDRGKLNADFLKEVLDDVKDNVEEDIEEAKDTIDDVLEDLNENEIIEPLNEDIILLEDENDINEFSQQICPSCHKGQLTPIDAQNGIFIIKCNDCGQEFRVEEASQNIYKKQ